MLFDACVLNTRGSGCVSTIRTVPVWPLARNDDCTAAPRPCRRSQFGNDKISGRSKTGLKRLGQHRHTPGKFLSVSRNTGLCVHSRLDRLRIVRAWSMATLFVAGLSLCKSAAKRHATRRRTQVILIDVKRQSDSREMRMMRTPDQFSIRIEPVFVLATSRARPGNGHAANVHRMARCTREARHVFLKALESSCSA